jgi:hypothetical protein
MEPEFTEIQHFRQKWLWAILFTVTAVSTYFSVINQGLRSGLIVILLMTPILISLYKAKLVTKIRDNKLSYQFYPFHLSEREINLDERKIEVTDYSPLKEFGGWGLRWRPGKIAFSVSGSKAIRINSDEGREIVLGTQKPEEVKEAVRDK